MIDWIPVYAEARVAFPPDVRLRTDDDFGRVKITAYRHEWEPPLPPELVGEVLPPIVIDRHGTTHRERIYALSFMVAGDASTAWLVRRAAQRWEHEAFRRARWREYVRTFDPPVGARAWHRAGG